MAVSREEIPLLPTRMDSRAATGSGSRNWVWRLWMQVNQRIDDGEGPLAESKQPWWDAAQVGARGEDGAFLK